MRIRAMRCMMDWIRGLNDWRVRLTMAKYFTTSEFDCKCGCGKNNTELRLLRGLDKARGKAGIPFHINSGCRCAEYNRKIGGSPTSSHLMGEAADIAAGDGAAMFRIVSGLLAANFKRIIVYKRGFIHTDLSMDKPQGMWVME